VGQDAYEGEDGKLQEGRGLGVYRCLKAHSRLEFSILDLDNVYFTRRNGCRSPTSRRLRNEYYWTRSQSSHPLSSVSNRQEEDVDITSFEWSSVQ